MAIPTPDYNQQQPFSLFKYTFRYNTPNLASGVPIVEPGPGFAIWDAFVVVETPFNGTTPKADIGFFEEPGVTNGFFDTIGSLAPVDLTATGAPFESTQINPPVSPAPTDATTGGTVAAGTYEVAVTYVNAEGETVASGTGTVTTTGATSTITVPSPSPETGATGWYAYVSQAGGNTLTRQQAAGSPTAIGTNLTLTAPPTNTGANPPSSNTTSGISTGPAVFKITAEESVRLVMARQVAQPNPELPPGPPSMPMLQLIANQTGAVGGAALNSTAGQASLYVLLAEPVDLSPSLDQPQLAV